MDPQVFRNGSDGRGRACGSVGEDSESGRTDFSSRSGRPAARLLRFGCEGPGRVRSGKDGGDGIGAWGGDWTAAPGESHRRGTGAGGAAFVSGDESKAGTSDPVVRKSRVPAH